MSGGRFERCLRFVLQEEGGYSNDPADHGKATNRGVSQATFDEAKKRGVVYAATVRDLTEHDVETIYWGLYWLPARTYEFHSPLDLCLFDAYVNHLPLPAVKLVQAAVGVEQDGLVGQKTINAALQVNKVTAVERYAYEREQLYRRIVAADHTQEKFLRGWLNRVAHVKSAALAEVA